MHEQEHMSMYLCAYRIQKSVLGVFLSGSALYLLIQGLSLNLVLTNSGSLASKLVSGILCLFLLGTGLQVGYHAFPASYTGRSWGSDLWAHTSAASGSSTEPSPLLFTLR